MEELLYEKYNVHVTDALEWDGKKGFTDNEYFYYIMRVKDKEKIHMEQTVLAYFLQDMGYDEIAIPIQTSTGKWISDYNSSKFIVFRVKNKLKGKESTHGSKLATFHQTAAVYRFQPQVISSYGQWKTLWIEKLTAIENTIKSKSKQYPTQFNRLFVEILPYLIGMSENAIQYVRECEYENRHHYNDQGTICFHRYENQLERSIIWPNEFVFDHPVRDLAEHIRLSLLNNNYPSMIQKFIKDYEPVRPLSIFGLRLLYARIIYPIHFFDLCERGIFEEENDFLVNELEILIEKQSHYEKNLKLFFEMINIDSERMQIPVIQWL